MAKYFYANFEELNKNLPSEMYVKADDIKEAKQKITKKLLKLGATVSKVRKCEYDAMGYDVWVEKK